MIAKIDTWRGDLVLQTVAMPADTNPHGDIFGGWIMSQMDIAAGIAAQTFAKSRVVTVAVDALVFHRPVFVGNVVSCHAELIRAGRTSVTFHIQAWVTRLIEGERELVTEGEFTFVAVDENKKPIKINREE